VEKLCTEIAIIHKGEVILQSPTTDIKNRIKNKQRKIFRTGRVVLGFGCTGKRDKVFVMDKKKSINFFI